MGNRISFSFYNPECKGYEESIAFFSHWDGQALLHDVDIFIQKIGKSESHTMPFDRREPNNIMLNFIVWFINRNTLPGEMVLSSYYLGKDSSDGDNSDNGHFRMNLSTGKWEGGR